MFFSRIVQSLKKQQWSNLTLELLIVVVGIFLGLQADSWYQSKSEQEQLEKYLQAVSDELASSTWIRERYVAWHERVIEGLFLALRRLDGESLDDEELERAYFGLVNINDAPTSPQRTAALEALKAEGMLRLVDDTLRRVLAEILDTSKHGEAPEYARNIGIIDAPVFSVDLVNYGFSDDENLVITRVDWNAAKLNPAFRQRVVQGIAAYSRLLRMHENNLVTNQYALEELARAGFEPSANWLEENQALYK